MIVGIDSMILIYAGLVPRKKGKGVTSEYEELSTKAKLLLHVLRSQQVVLPTVAISEILIPVASAKRGAIAAMLSENFICPSFDLPASSIAADLWAKYKNIKKPDHTRHVLRADAMIIASAKAAGATVFYSNDNNCRTLASLVMTAKGLPDRDPNDMFAAKDIEKGEL